MCALQMIFSASKMELVRTHVPEAPAQMEVSAAKTGRCRFFGDRQIPVASQLSNVCLVAADFDQRAEDRMIFGSLHSRSMVAQVIRVAAVDHATHTQAFQLLRGQRIQRVFAKETPVASVRSIAGIEKFVR